MGAEQNRIRSSWAHGFVEVDTGVRLHYVEQGEGPLMVLLHGFPECWYSWRHQIPAMAAEGYRVVAPDLRGYNESDKPPERRAYRMERLVADVKALIQRLGHDRAVVAGHDWGGAVAWQLALDHPELVERLAVFNCPHPAAWAMNMRRGGRYNFRQLGRSWYMFFFQVPVLPERLIARDPRGFVERAFRGMAANPDAFDDDDLDRFGRALERPGAARSAINYYRQVFRTGLAARVLTGRPPEVPPLSMPTLVVWGEQDRSLGRELTEGMERFFTGPFEIRYIPDAGHWVQQERPEACNEYLRAFLTRHEADARAAGRH